MRFIPSLAATMLVAVSSLAFNPVASARALQHSSADAKAWHDFTLTDGFLKKWEAVMSDPKAPTCSLMTINLKGGSLSERISHYDARPGNHAYLARHGLTAREMVLGTFTMAAAAMQEMSSGHPGLIEGNSGMQVSARNMAFHRSHKAEIQRFMQKIGQQRLRRDGGTLPNCAR